jgi:hypothetical protein
VELSAESIVRVALREQRGRLAHTEGVAGQAALVYPKDVLLRQAAWLHDIGYQGEAPDVDMHDTEVVGLFAWYTGAWFEADERGLLAELEEFDPPSEERLDALNLCDLATSPTGEGVTLPERIEEILRRYSAEHPVHRAVTRCQGELVLSCRRAITRPGLSEGWGLAAL